jgi:hypothetical protein
MKTGMEYLVYESLSEIYVYIYAAYSCIVVYICGTR